MRSSRILLSALAATTALVLAFASTASAGTLDQQQTSSTNGVDLSATSTPAQTFTAGISGGLDRVDLLLLKIGTPPASVTVEIRNTSAGQPGTGVLATASLPTSAIGTAEAFEPVTFATPAPVTAGTQYAVLAYTPGTPGDTVGWRYQNTGNPYSPGAMFISNDPLPPGGNWQQAGGVDDDLGFKTYVLPPFRGYPLPKKKCKKKKKKGKNLAAASKKKKCKKKKKR
jgi:hypothetical protein